MKLNYCRSTAFKNNLTAEHAKTAEVISAAAQNKDIIFSFSFIWRLVGAQLEERSLKPAGYMVFSARSAISAVKNLRLIVQLRISKRIKRIRIDRIH
jgi:hypothetical protein